MNAYLPAQNLEAEQGVLSAILLDNQSLGRVAPLLVPSDFYRKSHQSIYEAILTLDVDNEPIDMISLCECLKKQDTLEAIGGLSYLSTLMNFMPTAANAEYHARLVQESSRKRQVQRLAIEILSGNDDSETIISKMSICIESLFKRDSADIMTAQEVIGETNEYIERRSQERDKLSGFSTGFKDIDELTDGIQLGEYYLIAGRPSMGKTAFAKTLACNIASNDIPVALIELEMAPTKIGIRMVAAKSNIKLSSLIKGVIGRSNWQRITDSVASLSSLPIYFNFTASNIQELKKTLLQLVEGKKVKAIFIDYLQLLEGKEAQREQEIAMISRALKNFAQQHNVAVLALSQLSRAVEKRENKRPILSDLRESGQLEQDADVVMFLHREKIESPSGRVDIIFAKGRNIGLGTVYLYWDGPTQTFQPYIDMVDGKEES